MQHDSSCMSYSQILKPQYLGKSHNQTCSPFTSLPPVPSLWGCCLLPQAEGKVKRKKKKVQWLEKVSYGLILGMGLYFSTLYFSICGPTILYHPQQIPVIAVLTKLALNLTGLLSWYSYRRGIWVSTSACQKYNSHFCKAPNLLLYIYLQATAHHYCVKCGLAFLEFSAIKMSVHNTELI